MIRKSIKKGLSALLVTVSILSLVGCGGQKTLDGHYTVDTPTYNFPKTLNFESDGDCDYNDTLGITYKIEASTSALFPKSMILRKTETKSP